MAALIILCMEKAISARGQYNSKSFIHSLLLQSKLSDTMDGDIKSENIIQANYLLRVLAGGGWGDHLSFFLFFPILPPSQQPEKMFSSTHIST